MTGRADLAIVPGFRAARPVCAWRGLGRLADLDLDFASTDRPGLVSAVLTACSDPPLGADEEEVVWRLSLAARIGGLLAVLAATEGRAALDLTFRCPAPGCGAGMEAALPVAALLDLARAAEGAAETEVALPLSGPVRLRRPTGADQRLWRRRAYGDGAAAEAAVLEGLVAGGTLAAEDRAAAAEALAAFDPLSCFELDATCPHCGVRSDIAVDLEAVLLAALERAQARILAEIDRLARRYGWNEAEILAVPAWRRRRYLALEDDGWPL